jgi:hypothetical protein
MQSLFQCPFGLVMPSFTLIRLSLLPIIDVVLKSSLAEEGDLLAEGYTIASYEESLDGYKVEGVVKPPNFK